MTDCQSDDEAPAFDEEVALSIIGKHLLVGITHRNRADEVTSFEEFHGEIVRAGRDVGIIVRIDGSAEERWVPPDLSHLHAAAPGHYRLKSTGEVVVDPDFTATWTVYPPVRH